MNHIDMQHENKHERAIRLEKCKIITLSKQRKSFLEKNYKNHNTSDSNIIVMLLNKKL